MRRRTYSEFRESPLLVDVQLDQMPYAEKGVNKRARVERTVDQLWLFDARSEGQSGDSLV